jgi:hypothetical protein
VPQIAIASQHSALAFAQPKSLQVDSQRRDPFNIPFIDRGIVAEKRMTEMPPACLPELIHDPPWHVMARKCLVQNG